MRTVLTLLAACSGPTDVVDAPDPAPPGPEGLSVTWSDVIPTVATVSFEAPVGAVSHVEYGLGSAFDLSTPTATGEQVDLTVLGLIAGQTYAYRVVSLVDGDRREADGGDLVVPSAPTDLPRLDVTTSSPDAQVADGFVLVSMVRETGATSDTWMAIFTGAGDPVWWYREPTGFIAVSPTLGATPGTLFWDRTDKRDDAGAFSGVRIGIDGTGLVEVPLAEGHHAMVEPEAGTVAWIARDLRENPLGLGFVTADRILEAPLDSPEAWTVHGALFDDPWSGTLSAMCSHTTSALSIDGVSPVFEWSHMNSLVHLPSEDAYLVVARWADAVFLVDRSTGAVRWQLGGPDGDFALTTGGDPWGSFADSLLSHPHLSEAWPGGFVAFSNGSHLSPSVSSIVEWSWDESTMTAEEVFRYTHPDGRFSAILGDVRRLQDGHYLISWSKQSELTEITSEGEEVWVATGDGRYSTGRMHFIPDLYTLAR